MARSRKSSTAASSSKGPICLRATDVYTGRLLWERKLPGFGALYNNTAHHAGANGTGTNYISLPDGIYAIYPPGCVRLDPATGATMAEFQLPAVGRRAGPAGLELRERDRTTI